MFDTHCPISGPEACQGTRRLLEIETHLQNLALGLRQASNQPLDAARATKEPVFLRPARWTATSLTA